MQAVNAFHTIHYVMARPGPMPVALAALHRRQLALRPSSGAEFPRTGQWLQEQSPEGRALE
jgi:hypothetical protein